MEGRQAVTPITATSWANVAQDYWDGLTDLNEVLIEQPAATFLFHASGDGLAHLGIFSGDLLIVDRSVTHRLGHVLVVATETELVIGQFIIHGGKAALRTQHGGIQALTAATQVWGVVIRSVRTHLGPELTTTPHTPSPTPPPSSPAVHSCVDS